MAKINDKTTQSNWPRITLTDVKINGNSAQVYTTAGLFESQRIILQKTGQEDLPLIVAMILDERFIILRSGKQVAIEDFSAYDGCVITAPDQVRPTPNTNPNWQGFQDFPVLAYRDLPVSHHGNPLTTQLGVLDMEDVEVRLIYNSSFQIQEIREFEKQPFQRYVKPFTSSNFTSSFTMSEPLLPFMKEIGNKILYYEEQNKSVSNPAVYTITGFQGNTIQVTPSPPDRASLYSVMDGRIGNRLKSTQFEGQITIERISPSTWDVVNIMDIIGDAGIGI